MKLTLSLLFTLLLSLTGYSQEDASKSLFWGTGIGIMNNSESEGFGFIHGIGFQSSVWHNRIRLIPQFTWGAFNNNGITDVPDAHFYSRSAKLDLNFDLLRFRNFSMIVGTGVTGNLTSGLVGTGGDINPIRSSYFFSETHVGVNVALGFRLYSRDKRVAYELRLFDVGFKPIHNTDFVEAAVFKFQLLYTIKTTDKG